ncbi:MAG: O-antigen ligase domain-containing protein [Rhodocyclaceae bacterium]|nr:MAG: O-antigen ligase domain-containing protein [Rhodocyclaceae bacterium]
MPEHLKTIVIILGLALPYFLAARAPATVCIEEGDYLRRRNLWLGVTLSAFLAHNYWVHILVAGGLILYWSAGRERNPVALYCFLLFAAPALPNPVPGFGIINYVFDMQYHRLLSLTLLAPAALALYKDSDSPRPGTCLTDKLVLAYVGYSLFLVYMAGTFTNFLRVAFTQSLDILLPYYVASRALRNLEDFRDALMSFVVAAAVMAPMGAFESIKQWLLYAPLKEALDVPIFGHPLLREDSLRAEVALGQPIPYGYVMAVALGYFLFLQKTLPGIALRVAGVLLIAVGLVVSYSRGPWLGALLMVLTYLLSGPRPGVQIVKLAAGGALVVGILMATPEGDKITGLLPFVGDAEGGTVDYRQQLLETFLPIVLDNPIFGASDFLYSPAVEALRQGEGIIDIVNSYLFIGLYNGMVGLALFISFFIAVGAALVKGMRLTADKDSDRHRLGQSLLGTLVGILFIIVTVSSISAIPYIYWMLGGMGAAYLSLAQRSLPKATPAMARIPHRRPPRRRLSASG